MIDTTTLKALVREAVRDALKDIDPRPAKARTDSTGFEDDKSLVSRKEAARRLAVSLQTIATLIKEGHIAHVRIRRRVLIPAEELDRYLNHTAQSGKEGGRP